jgi:Polysaccharide deacetylase
VRVLAVVLALVLGASALALLALRSRGDSEPSDIPVIAYHGVTTDPAVVTGAADPRFLAVRLSEFRAQMKYLNDEGFETITPTQYRQWLSGETSTLPSKPILITFDDGETSTQLATPVLNQHGFVATMYVASGFADGDFGGPRGEEDWYLTWDQLEAMRANGTWTMQFHAGPQGHAIIRNPAFPDCHHFYPCRFGEDDATYEARVKADVAQGLGAMRSVFELPAGWRGPTFAVPWDDAGQTKVPTEPWLAAYFATQFPVVFVQDGYAGDVNNQRYRYEVHNSDDLERFKSGLSSERFAR